MFKKHYKLVFTLILLFSLGIITNMTLLNSVSAFQCENDTCIPTTAPDGTTIGLCIDHSSLPGGQDGLNCDATGGSSCILTGCED